MGRLEKFSAKNPVVLELGARGGEIRPNFFVARLRSDGFSLKRPRESVSLLGKGCKVRLGAALET